MDIDYLKEGIRFAMMENLMIQFVYPEGELPKRYAKIINSIDHVDIRPFTEGFNMNSNVLVYNELPLSLPEKKMPTTIFRLTVQEFFDFPYYLAEQTFQYIKKLNIIIILL